MSKQRNILLVVLILLLLAGGYVAGVATAPALQRPSLVPLDATDAQPQFEVFWEAWRVVDNHFVDEAALDAKERTYGAISGMVNALGDVGHTRFLSPEDLKEEEAGLTGRFEGIGAEVGLREGRPVIITPLAESPAERAGVMAGDVIVAVDGQDTAHMTLQEVIRRIRGAKGTPVRLSVVHPGETAIVEVTIVRDEIRVRAVVARYLPQHEIGHVRITQFAANANNELISALEEMRRQGARALVIDVRNNPGGLLDQAVAVSSQFLKEGNVLLEESRSGQRQPFEARRGGVATDIPMAVLINRGSASAAEIFAGAIKDNGRGSIIGEPSFGTGTVLSTFQLSDGSALLLATAQWLTPNGTAIRNNGITPDIRVSPAPVVAPVNPFVERQLSEDDLLRADAVLRAAVEELSR